MSLIEVRHLRKEYPNVVPLKDVNAYIDRGEVCEADPPEQVFEHPRRRETFDFAFRVRAWK